MRKIFLLFVIFSIHVIGRADVPVVGKITQPTGSLCAGDQLKPDQPVISWSEDSLACGWLLDGKRVSMPYQVTVGDDGKELVFWARSCTGVGYSDTVKVNVVQFPVMEKLTVSPVCNGMKLELVVPQVTNGVPILDTVWRLNQAIFDTTTILISEDNGKLLECVLRSCSGSSVSNGIRLVVNSAPILVPMPVAGMPAVGENLDLQAAGFQGEDTLVNQWTLAGVQIDKSHKVLCEDRGKQLIYMAESRCGVSRDTITLQAYSSFPTIEAYDPKVHANDTLKWKAEFYGDRAHLNLWTLAGDTIIMPYKVNCRDAGKTLTYAGSSGCDTLRKEWVLEIEEYKPFIEDERDNRQYHVKKMADGKWWMNEDLRYGTPVTADGYKNSCNKSSKELGSGEWGVCREDNTVAGAGYFYNWQAAMQLTDEEYNNPSLVGPDKRRGICPAGWHLPTRQDFIDLVAEMGGTDDGATMTGTDGVNIMKDFTDKDGVCGGSVILSGFIKTDGNRDAESSAYFWSSTQEHSQAATLLLSGSGIVIPKNSNGWSQGCVVRCVADDGFNPAKTN